MRPGVVVVGERGIPGALSLFYLVSHPTPPLPDPRDTSLARSHTRPLPRRGGARTRIGHLGAPFNPGGKGPP